MEGEKAQLAKARQAAEPATPAPAKTLPAKATPVKAVREPPPVHYLTLIPAEQAVTTLKAFWPQLFEGDHPHLLATGIREALFADIAQKDLPLSHKQVLSCLKSLTRADVYLSPMRPGRCGWISTAGRWPRSRRRKKPMPGAGW
ncbi:ProQ/FINO family protein [Enterobacter mori]